MRAFLWRWCVQPIVMLLKRLGRWFACFIAVSRALILCRRCARYAGEYLKKLGKELVQFGEKDSDGRWGAELFNHLPFALLEVTGNFSGSYLGVISTAYFECFDYCPEKRVVIQLIWRGEPQGQRLSNFWEYGEESKVVIDPAKSPLHVLPDGTLWFMWPTGETGVIRGKFGPVMKKYVRFRDNDELPKVRERKESHFNL